MTARLLPVHSTTPDSDVQLLKLENDVIKPTSTFHATPFTTRTVHNASDESESDASGECEREREQETVLLGFTGRRGDTDTDSDATDTFSKGPRSMASQWTGTPIRAIIPLPHRKMALNGSKGSVDASRSVGAPTVVGSPSSRPGVVSWVGQPLARAVWDDLDSDSEDEDDEDDEDSLGRGTGRAEYCSYESITAAEGLTAWSFEELRVECYAQSLVARGTKPPPVVQPTLAIPPAFVPRIVQRELDPNFLVVCK